MADELDESREPPDSRPDPPAPVPWGVGHAAIGFLAGVIGSSVAAGIWVGVTRESTQSFGLLVVSLLGLWLGYLATIVATSRRKGTGDIRRDLRLRVAGFGDVVMGIGAGLASSFILIPIVYAVLLAAGIVHKTQLDRLSDPAERISRLASGPPFLVLCLFIGIGAPVVEELFFRGFLQPALAKRVGHVAAIAITAVVFGAAHFEALQFPALAAFGAVLGALAWRTGRLGPGIFAHMAFNALTLVQLAMRQRILGR